ncbi:MULTISPECIES: ferrochelatase [Alteromonadaceae]|uniref:Ferrochelatase n=1 Tax=Brumicola blandensis TaxID=3075611 RepID=A0AAW8R2K9_9ALTE|nr:MULTISPECIES: ferrochelatase [unclassified Alteromonas]MDT0583526.1 ferrochelatase [Alteromonas sp. W409]MDT0629461.1 ferrochelatase [Alteromonas sp. W364]
MKYQSQTSFTHAQADKIGVLVSNLGTPQAPTKQALKPYLKQFLSDPRVVEVPKVIWWCVLNLIILNIRPKRSAEAYSTVWTEEGSPLLVHTKNQSVALERKLQEKYGDNVIIDYAMRYGQPSVSNAIESLLSKGARKIVVLPLYPQYCASTTGSTFDAVAEDFVKRRWLPDMRFISHYHDNPEYIQCIADKIKKHWETHPRADKLIFSYHGIPKRYLLNGDPYHCECHKTTRLVAEALGLHSSEYMTTFQSRFGREEWLKPYTDHTLKALPETGVRSVQVVCPGFSSDCLETIEEIGEENREYFEEAGGERYEYIEALNSDDQHIDMLFNLIESNLQGWNTELNDASVYEQRNKLAEEMGVDQVSDK